LRGPRVFRWEARFSLIGKRRFCSWRARPRSATQILQVDLPPHAVEMQSAVNLQPAVNSMVPSSVLVPVDPSMPSGDASVRVVIARSDAPPVPVVPVACVGGERGDDRQCDGCTEQSGRESVGHLLVLLHLPGFVARVHRPGSSTLAVSNTGARRGFRQVGRGSVRRRTRAGQGEAGAGRPGELGVDSQSLGTTVCPAAEAFLMKR
jgi:hypothetical protein